MEIQVLVQDFIFTILTYHANFTINFENAQLNLLDMICFCFYFLKEWYASVKDKKKIVLEISSCLKLKLFEDIGGLSEKIKIS